MVLNGISSVVCGGETWHQNSTKSSSLHLGNMKKWAQKELADLFYNGTRNVQQYILNYITIYLQICFYIWTYI